MVYEIGAKVLESIPESVRAHTNVDFSALPRILASCDGIVKDGSSGRLVVRAVLLPSRATIEWLSIHHYYHQHSSAASKSSSAFIILSLICRTGPENCRSQAPLPICAVSVWRRSVHLHGEVQEAPSPDQL